MRANSEAGFRNENEEVIERSRKIAKLYELSSDVSLKEITQNVLRDPMLSEAQKEAIQKNNRQIFIFTYPSDGLKIKGVISFVPDPDNHSTIVFLRGGTGIFGTLHPGSDLLNMGQYTVIATMYRGGVSEGIDEYGGSDVNDVKNLVEYIPELERQLGLNCHQNKTFLIGGSRGAMQMFLALSRFPELQTRFSKIVSYCGLLDIRETILRRSEMEEMFTEDFGLEKGVNEEEWINKRNPILAADKINTDLPILIMQGTADDRVSLEEGYHMIEKLQSMGNQHVTYLEIEKGEHGLKNAGRVKLILDWLEE